MKGAAGKSGVSALHPRASGFRLRTHLPAAGVGRKGKRLSHLCSEAFKKQKAKNSHCSHTKLLLLLPKKVLCF